MLRDYYILSSCLMIGNSVCHKCMVIEGTEHIKYLALLIDQNCSWKL